MAFEKIYLLGKIELDLIATSVGVVTIQTDIPGQALADRGTVPIPICTRRNVQKRLPYSFQGHLFKFTYASAGQTRLYGVRIWARELPTGMWQWYPLPVVDTPNAWSSAPINIPATPNEFSSVKISIPETSDTWNATKLGIPGTPEEWGETKLPIKPTPPVPDWFSLEIDA